MKIQFSIVSTLKNHRAQEADHAGCMPIKEILSLIPERE